MLMRLVRKYVASRVKEEIMRGGRGIRIFVLGCFVLREGMGGRG